jgi:predicted RNase H-like HicB family nuclease
MENISEDIGEEVISQLKELIRLIEEKLKQNGNKQDNSCGLHRIHENPAQ